MVQRQFARSTVPALLEARARPEPDRTAFVVDGIESLTFGEWDRRSNAVARGLLDRGVARGDRIGLQFGNHDWIEFVIAYCGVQKSGGVAVPLSDRLSPLQVAERLAHCSATGVLHGADGAPAVGDPPAGAAAAPEVWTVAGAELAKGDGRPVGIEVRPDDLGEILYTSGTTGRPKGVCATHANLAFAPRTVPPETPGASLWYTLSTFPIGSNAAQVTLLSALTRKSIRMVASRYEAEAFCGLIESFRVTMVSLVPAMGIDLVNRRVNERHDLSSVIRVGSGSAPLPPAIARALTELFPNAVVVNAYLSTESSPARTSMIFDPARPGSVGKPDRDGDLMIVDAKGRPLGPGEVGEVCLRCPADQRAYYRDPEATARTFAGGWTRMGDHGYLDADGYLHLVDRDADVIKVGGTKVSTLAVEAALYEHPEVVEAAVVGLPHPVMGRMVAAAVVTRAEVAPATLRSFLQGRLAAHELPTRFLALDALPRNAQGKPVKREIRELFTRQAAAPRIAPSTPTEAALAELWSAVLDAPEVGIDDDFFVLGGDSLAAAQLATRAGQRFGLDIPATVLFDLPVLAHLAAWIDARAPGPALAGRRGRPARRAGGWGQAPPGPGASAAASTGTRTGEPVRLVLSPFQERTFRWSFGQLRARRTRPVAIAFRIGTDLDLDLFGETMRELARRHQSLRTVFRVREREALALPSLEPELTSANAAGDRIEEREADARRLAARLLERPFDLERGPLFRSMAVRLGARDHVLMLAADHLVCDGLSLDVLLREANLLYSALGRGAPSPLPPLPLQISDFLDWVHRQYPRTRAFWRRALDGAPVGIGPLQGQEPGVSTHTDAFHGFSIPAEVVDRLRAACVEHRVTMFILTMSIWVATLAQWTGAPEVVLSSPMSGRTRAGFETLVGSVLQNPFYRVRSGGRPSFRELLARVRKTVAEAIEHQHFPHHEFIPQVRYAAHFRYDDWFRRRGFNGRPIERFRIPGPALGDRPLPAAEADRSVPRIRLGTQPDGTIAVTLNYNGNAFDGSTMERLADDFLRLTRQALDDPERPLGRETPTPRTSPAGTVATPTRRPTGPTAGPPTR